MEKTELSPNDNCFICCEYMGPFKNELTVVTGYSEKPIFRIFGKSFIFKVWKKNLKYFFLFSQNCF